MNMTVETICRTYLETDGICPAQGLDETMDSTLDILRRAGAGREDLMGAEEAINHMLDLQEAMAFQAGFRAAFNLVFDAAHGAAAL